MTDRLNLLLQDKYIVRVTIALVAISILVPGVLKVGPPQWLHTPDTLVESTESDVASVDSGMDARPLVNPDVAKSKSAATKDAPEDASAVI
ncbi:MAG: hypothetical protein ACPH74_03630, partial [Candidatus Puniceispirillum sp.]